MVMPSPDFRTPRADGAWFVSSRTTGRPQICSTDAWSIASLARAELREQLRVAGGGLRDPDGQPADAILSETPSVDGSVAWDAPLFRAAWALATRYNAAPVRLGALASAVDGQISVLAVETVLWLAFENAGYRGEQRVYGVGNPDEVAISPDATLPNFGVGILPPADLRGGLSGRYPRCRVSTDEEVSLSLRPLRWAPSVFQIGLLFAVAAGAVWAASELASRPIREGELGARQRRR